MLAALYARVSTDRQEKQKTIQSQIKAIKEYAGENNYNIVKEYKDDGWSGTMLARPKLDELRDDAKKGIWEAVLINDRDRLARKLAYQEFVIDELRENNIQVVFLNEPLAEDAEGRILQQIKGVFADYERIKTAERMRRGKMYKAKDGHVVTSQAPFGYTYIKKNGDKHGFYKVNKQEARVVRKIFSWVADEGLTIRNVVRRLKKQGIQPRKSKRGVWNTSTLTTLLRRKDYIGTSFYNKSYAVVPEKPIKEEKYKKVKKSSRRLKDRNEWVEIPVPTIIGKDLYERARKRLKANYELSRRNRKNNYLLAGKIYCICGRKRSGEGPQKGKHLYYRCTDRVYSFPLPPNCRERSVNARVADKLVWIRLNNLMSKPDLIARSASRWEKKGAEKPTILKESIEDLQHQLEKKTKEEQRYIKVFGTGMITQDQLQKELDDLRERKSELETQITQIQSETENMDYVAPTTEEIKLFSKIAEEVLGDLSFEVRRGILLKVIDKITGTQEKLDVRGFLPIHQAQNVKFKTKRRYCWTTKCGEVYAI